MHYMWAPVRGRIRAFRKGGIDTGKQTLWLPAQTLQHNRFDKLISLPQCSPGHYVYPRSSGSHLCWMALEPGDHRVHEPRASISAR
jgi:hypothetical protein